MKKALFIGIIAAALALVCFAPGASAYTVYSGKFAGGPEWMLDDAGALTLYGTGSTGEFHYNDAEDDYQTPPWFYIRERITSVTVLPGVDGIGNFIFYNCENLTRVTLPEGLKNIGKYAFYKCYALEEIAVPDSVLAVGTSAFDKTAWYDAQPDGLLYTGKVAYGYKGDMPENTVLRLKDGTRGIAGSAFAGCAGLKNITVPDSVCAIGISALKGTAWLNAQPDGPVYAGKVLYTLKGELGVYSDFIFEPGTKGIAASALQNCTWIRSTVIPESVVYIGNEAFSGCNRLIGVTCPGSVELMGRAVFYSCSRLADVTLPENLTELPDSTFRYCTALQSVTLPSGVKYIFPHAFRNCYKLESVDLGHSLTAIGNAAFAECTALETLVLPEGLEKIGNRALCECTSLGGIVFPDTLKSIGYSAFADCRALREITFPASLQSVGDDAFYDTGLQTVNAADLAAWCGIEFGYYSANPLYLTHTLYVNGAPVTDLVIPDGVTRVGRSAFNYCTSLTSVTFPPSVKTVGETAFFGCTGLKGVYISDLAAWCGVEFENGNPLYYANTLYLNGAPVTDLVVPDGVTRIGRSAFDSCSSLRSVTIPDSVTSIGSYAFYRTAWLNAQPAGVVYAGKVAYTYNGDMPNNTSLKLRDGTLGIADLAFINRSTLKEISIPESVRIIGDNAFTRCSALTHVTLPAGIKEIGRNAFSETGITWVLIPEGVTRIGKTAFGDTGEAMYYEGSKEAWQAVDAPVGYTPGGYDCAVIGGILYAANGTDLVKAVGPGPVGAFTVPAEVVTIRARAFSRCDTLTEITVPEGITRIELATFSYCSHLTKVTLPDTVTAIDASAFGSCAKLERVTLPKRLTSLGSSAFSQCGALKEIELPEGLTSLSPNTFQACESLERVKLPDGMTAIGNYAFVRCLALSDITVPAGVTSIGESAFAACSSLLRLVLPNGVTSLGKNAFSGCSGMEILTLPAGLKTIGENAFSNCSALKCYMSTKTAWSKIKNPSKYTPDLYNCSVTNGVLYANNEALAVRALETEDLTSLYLPKTVTEIRQYAFYGCTSMQEASLPQGLKTVGAYAFYGCSALRDIYSLGTQEAWDTIGIAAGNQPLKDASLHFVTYVVTPETIGDLDGDGKRTASDARLALRAAVELDPLTDELKDIADADRDGAVTASDARLILRAAVELENPADWLKDPQQ